MLHSSDEAICFLSIIVQIFAKSNRNKKEKDKNKNHPHEKNEIFVKF